MGTIQDKLNYLSTTKGLIKQAIIDKGQQVADTDTFRSYANKISAISGGNLNIFVQQTEPETKKGIWLKRDSIDISGIVQSHNVLLEGEWQEDGVYTPMPRTGHNGNATIVGNCIYIFGGYQSSDKPIKYDISTNSYTQLANLPKTFAYGAVAAVGTDIYLLDPYTLFFYKYDALTNTYTELTRPTTSSSFATFGNQNIVAVGTNLYCIMKSTMFKYDTLTDTWTTLIKLPKNYTYPSAVAVGTNIFVFGWGSTDEYKVYKYNILTNTYVEMTNNPITSGIGSAVAVGTDVYLFGKTEAYKYDTLLDTYTQLTNIPFEFSQGDAVYYDNRIFLLGGYDYPSKIQCLSLIDATFAENNVIINQSEYADSLYKAQLFSSPLLLTDIPTYFYDVYLYKNSKIEKDIPTYIGDGTQWTCFKNEPIDTEGATE